MADLSFVVVIPARFASTRLPGKPLAMIAGEPMVRHVARRALDAGAAEVAVAIDDERVGRALDGLPVRVCMTRADHASGSDRIAECVDQAGWRDDTIVVNLQGDEPFAPASGIQAVAAALLADDAPMATLATPVSSVEELLDVNTVKLVRDGRGRAMYFSRSALPWARDAFARDRHALPPDVRFLRHIGIYAYRAGFLRTYASLPQTPLERAESLEQLRVLENGHPIAVRLAPEAFPPGIDTAADLERANRYLAGG